MVNPNPEARSHRFALFNRLTQQDVDDCASRSLERVNGCFDFWAYRIEGFAKIVGQLDTEPVTGLLPEVCTKMKVGFGRDTTLLIYDFVHALLWQFGILRQSVRSDAKRPKEFLAEKFAWVDVQMLFHDDQW